MTAGLLDRIDALLPPAPPGTSRHPAPSGAATDAAGAALRDAVEAPDMSEESALALLVAQVADLGRTLATQAETLARQAVSLAEISGDMRALVARADGADRAHGDHEARIRDLERSRPAADLETRVGKLEQIPHPGADHEQRIRKLERAVWIAAGLGLAGGGAFGAIFGG